MSALRLRTVDTADLLTTPAPRLRPATPWPYRIAVPFIMLASLVLWAIFWQAATFTIAVLVN